VIRRGRLGLGLPAPAVVRCCRPGQGGLGGGLGIGRDSMSSF
jgi:hypothetical protein